MQASYTDIILIVCFSCAINSIHLIGTQNKWEHVSEQALDMVMDHLYTLNDETPKIRCEGKNGVDADLIFGIESKLSLSLTQESAAQHDDVETISIFQGGEIRHDSQVHIHDDEKLSKIKLDKEALIEGLSYLPRESIWRVKGFAKLSDGSWVSVNWAFGRYDIQEYKGGDIEGSLRMTVMGSRGAVRESVRRFCVLLQGD